MSTRTMWISDSKYRALPKSLREELLSVLSRGQLVGLYAANIESELRARGEHELADCFLEELLYLPYPLRP